MIRGRQSYSVVLLLAWMAAWMAPLRAVSAADARPDESGVSGPWHGSIRLPGKPLSVIVNVIRTVNAWSATIDIPDQGARGLSLENVTVSMDAVHFELPSPLGRAVFEGRRRGEAIEGTMTQVGVKAPFTLRRGAEPVRPEPPVPYLREDVGFQSGPIRFAGTLTRPRGKGPFPSVVLLTGSGAHDRDETIFGMKPFEMIADGLTRRGLAVLRYDDRGAGSTHGGPSKMASTVFDFAADALNAVKYLRGRPEIDPKAIGLLGHSEGGWTASVAAAQSDAIRFIVFLSGPGVAGKTVLAQQLHDILHGSGASNADVSAAAALQARMLDAIRSGQPVETLRKPIEAQIRKAWTALTTAQRAQVGSEETFVQTMTTQQLALVGTPWFQSVMLFDPAPYLAKVKCPVLALFADRDTQVEPRANLLAMQAAFKKGGNAHAETAVVPNANHLYQKATTGLPAEYPLLEKRFVPELIPRIADWILKNGRAK